MPLAGGTTAGARSPEQQLCAWKRVSRKRVALSSGKGPVPSDVGRGAAGPLARSCSPRVSGWGWGEERVSC